jgi:hypothetical protein
MIDPDPNFAFATAEGILKANLRKLKKMEM